MTWNQLIGLLIAPTFVLGVIAFLGLVGIVFQVFVMAVSVRILFFMWRAIGFLETVVQEVSLKQRGLWVQGSQKALDDFHHSQAARWRAAIAGFYVLWLGSIVVGVFFALGQPAAWLLLFVMLSLLLIIAIMVAFN